MDFVFHLFHLRKGSLDGQYDQRKLLHQVKPVLLFIWPTEYYFKTHMKKYVIEPIHLSYTNLKMKD